MDDTPTNNVPPMWLARVAEATSRARDTGELVESLLTLLQEMTGLESTYLTRIDWEGEVQEIVRSLNVGALTIGEGLLVPWSDTLCRRALDEGVPWADDVPDRWGDSDAARELGIQTYVSVPVGAGAEDLPWGTLCGVASETRPVDPLVLSTMELFAMIVGHAIREDHRVEQAEARLKATTEFIAMAEHAMKTPAATARMWAQLLLQRQDSMTADEFSDGLGRIRDAADRMLSLLQDMLARARAEMTAHELTKERVELRAVATRVAEELSTPEHPVVVAGDRVIAWSDPSAIAIVLDHLVDNGRSYTPDGCTTTIGLRRVGDRAIIEVRDDGPGLPDGIDIFEPFVRGTTEGHGTGLGLAIVHGLVTALDGEIRATNDDGAVFTISLAVPSD